MSITIWNSSPGSGTVELHWTSDNYIGFIIKLPESICRLIIPPLKASGHWMFAPGVYLDEKYCFPDQGFTIGNAILYFRTKQF